MGTGRRATPFLMTRLSDDDCKPCPRHRFLARGRADRDPCRSHSRQPAGTFYSEEFRAFGQRGGVCLPVRLVGWPHLFAESVQIRIRGGRRRLPQARAQDLRRAHRADACRAPRVRRRLLAERRYGADRGPRTIFRLRLARQRAPGARAAQPSIGIFQHPAALYHPHDVGPAGDRAGAAQSPARPIVSAGLYAAARAFDVNLPNWPQPGGWFFNPSLGSSCSRWGSSAAT